MAKSFEFQFDLDDDEETWLTPQLSERSVGTQSKPVDLKEWFGQIQTSDRASLLSKKLQKYAQKRVLTVELSPVNENCSLCKNCKENMHESCTKRKITLGNLFFPGCRSGSRWKS
ncbi:hypothetical protein NECAME_04441 [Necator americanus]|uniref:Uncharacterized protein n=1 Tax=Necator americanus TaxID=51031 RepID=W2SS17_NECAM|nr:hypothetical protein NECAME_04441 [Necator americanus]ETN72544.1 hypothetical protein NECAME_04441 [Necator americanus]